MAWRLRYSFNVDWVPPGAAQFGSPNVPGPGAGNNQTIQFLNVQGGQNIAGAATGNTLQGSDITTLTNAAAADMAAQLNANLARINGFATGLG